MHNIVLSNRIKEVLDDSGYHSKYLIPEEEYQEILSFYHCRGMLLSTSIKDLIRVFGNRQIRYKNDSIPSRKTNYKINFDLKAIWGKFKTFNYEVIEARIEKYEHVYSLENLVPICIMETGPMTFYIDKKGNIYGFIDELIVVYKGNSAFLSMEKLLNGQKDSNNKK